MIASPARIAADDLRFEPGRSCRHSRPACPWQARPTSCASAGRSNRPDRCGRPRWPQSSAAMQRRAGRPEFQHVAEHRDAPAAAGRPRPGRARERRRHRGRIGVVAFVDQRRLAIGQPAARAARRGLMPPARSATAPAPRARDRRRRARRRPAPQASSSPCGGRARRACRSRHGRGYWHARPNRLHAAPGRSAARRTSRRRRTRRYGLCRAARRAAAAGRTANCRG